MLRSPGDPQDVHLRQLLGQRATQSRVPSISEFSDSDAPSLYSYFSPQPHHNAHMQDMSSNLASPSHSSDRNRLNDLAVSMLDMDDDPEPRSYSSDDGDQSTVEQAHSDEDQLPMPRMSLGPKMRFHSKAPWEMDNSALHEEEESEDDIDSQSVMSSSTRSKARPFPFGGSKSAHTSRSSRDSSRSRQVAKKSFDTASSHGRGAIHTLAQASLSTTSLGAGTSRQYSTGVRSISPSSFRLSPSSPRSPGFVEDRSSGSGDSESRPSFAYSVEDTHPYARSDATSPPRSLPPRKVVFPAAPRGDTASTLAESKTPMKQSSLGLDSAYEPMPHSPRLQAFGRGISSPLGTVESVASPPFNLISLEEARAQRSWSITSQSANTKPTVATTHQEEERSEQGPTPALTSRARARSISAGARAKQALTSIVGNTPPKPERRESEPAFIANQGGEGKTLKHKKSGFMRLFNSGRDEKSPPPPVPSLSEGFAAFNAQQSLQSTAPKGNKLNRVPPPQVSPSMFEPPKLFEDNQSSSEPTPSLRRTPPPLNLLGSTHVIGIPRPQFLGDAAQSAPANVTEFQSLKLRPISTVFSAQFGNHILPSLTSDDEPDTPSSLQSPTAVISPITPGPYSRPEQQISKYKATGSSAAIPEDQSAVIRALQDQIVSAKRAWQRQIWELEGQVRDLKAEIGDLRGGAKDGGFCELCGRGQSSRESSVSPQDDAEKKPVGVVNRPRARTGTGQSRFGS